MIRAVVIPVWVALVTVISALAAIAVSFLRRGGDFSHVVGRCWAKSVLFATGVKVTVQGLHHIIPGDTYVYMANHQSMYDILALLGYLPVQFRWLAKKELFQIPLFGHSMARVGYISIDRSNRRSAHKSLLEAAQKIAGGVSVVIFPEGSRSIDGQIKPFRGGGFHLAIRSGRPIVPVAICGTHEVMPKGSRRVKPGRVSVSVNPPVATASYDNKTKRVLMELVRSIMEQDFERLRRAQA